MLRLGSWSRWVGENGEGEGYKERGTSEGDRVREQRGLMRSGTYEVRM